MNNAIRALIGLSLGAMTLAAAELALADEQAMVKRVNQKVAIIDNLHKKAQRALVTAAQDKVFPEYFSTSKDKTALKGRIDKVSLTVQSRFDVDEMCLIDENGHEHSRIVGNAIAPDEDLSTEEASAPFFDLAFALQQREVAVAPIYLSADTLRWVVAYVTPLMAGDAKPAILHFEHNLHKYRDLVNKGVSGEASYVLMLTREGYIFSDSRKDIPLEAQGEAADHASYFDNIKDWEMSGMDKVVEAVNSGEEGVTRVKDASGAEYIIAYKPSESWSILAVEKQ